jgi:hypothetical protein
MFLSELHFPSTALGPQAGRLSGALLTRKSRNVKKSTARVRGRSSGKLDDHFLGAASDQAWFRTTLKEELENISKEAITTLL